mmetsp:Transcript_33254/g.62007  ORF Transcript_33254/g.62007 Transcript_33254/m.62007 type:complete len:100 (-) Transcript_33254:54-353(-)
MGIIPGEKQEVNGKEYYTCMHIYDLHSFCISFRSQLSQVRRHGKPEDCTTLFSDWKKCMTAKAVTDMNKKQAILDTMKVNEPPHQHSVWEYKDKPSFFD